MEIGATTALIPAEPSTAVTLKTPRDPGSGLATRGSKTRQEFVFLGYGPSSGGDLYDGGGRPVRHSNNPGSMVDLYA